VTSIQMPQLGETIVEGTILKWLKSEGDQVKADEPLFEISTDKVDTEVPSPVAGTVTKLLVAEGATVPVGTAVMEIDDGGPATAAPPDASGGTASSDDSAPASTTATVSRPATDADQKPVVAVNPKTVTERDGRKLVFRLKDDTVEAVPVTPGRMLGDALEVTGTPLKSGDKLVLSPDAKLQAGAKVSVAAGK